MKQIYVVMRFESGKMLVVIDWGIARIYTPEQYKYFLKQYPQ